MKSDDCMLWIDGQLVPDGIATSDLLKLQSLIDKCKTVDKRKLCVKEFAGKQKITFQEATAVAKMLEMFVEDKP